MIDKKRTATAWTTPPVLRKQVQRLWDRGDLLNSVLDQLAVPEASEASRSIAFPLQLRLKKPTSGELSEQFSDVRAWIKSLSEMRHTRLELLEKRHPQLGKNNVPNSIWVDSLEDALAFIGKRGEAEQFMALVLESMQQNRQLIPWIRKHSTNVLALAPVWSRLLRVHDQIVQRSDKAMYLRQLSISGVDTKFVEAHRSTLAQWLDLTLPDDSINIDYRGIKGFARRYGFKEKPTRLRLRSLDHAKPLLQHANAPVVNTDSTVASADITLDIDVIQTLDPTHSHVIITENEINYLVLPDREDMLAVFGSGYGLESLGKIDWLKKRNVWYWGDLDTHGFAILNELRTRLPNVKSLLMDRETLMAHEALWGGELSQANRRLEHLSDEEAALHQDLIDNRYGDRIRLEQEQIDYGFMLAKLVALSK